MKLLVDNQLPLQLAKFLRSRGHDCVHVLEAAMDEVNDIELWAHAAGEGRIVVSKDDDFVALCNRPGDTGRLIWVRLGNCRNQTLLAAFEAVHDDLVSAFAAGQRIVELR
jgi:predicted nuclease of predicted toxin-antitoxin system